MDLNELVGSAATSLELWGEEDHAIVETATRSTTGPKLVRQFRAVAMRVDKDANVSIRRSGSTVLIGSVLGHGAGLLFTLFMARVYSPSVYGSFATVLALSSVLIGVSTMRLEVRAHAEDDQSATALYHLALRLASAWAISATLVALFCVVAFDVDRTWLWSGLIVMFGSTHLIASAYLARSHKFKQLGFGIFVHGASLGGGQLVLGLLRAGTASLALGFVVSRSIWVPTVLRAISGARADLTLMWLRVRGYARVAGLTALINSLGGQLPVLIASGLYGEAVAGLYAMMARLLVAPLAIVGQSVAAASLGHIGRSIRSRDGAGVSMLIRTVRDLSIVGAVPCLALIIWGPDVASLLLGAEWREVGVLMSFMAAGAFMQFIAAPFTQLLNITGASRRLLLWDLIRLVLFSVALVAPSLAGGSFRFAIALFSVAHVLTYGLLLWMVWRIVGSNERRGRSEGMA